MTSDRKKCIIVLAVTLTLFILVGIFLIVAFFKEIWPFQKYTRAPLPTGFYYPTGDIVQLSQKELDRNQRLLSCLNSVGINKFNSECVAKELAQVQA